jgi:uncharacterized protein (TIGR03437 family)
MALIALVPVTLTANSLFVLPSFQSTSTADGSVFDGTDLRRLATFTSPTDGFTVLTRPTSQPADVRYYVIARGGSSSIVTLDRDFRPVGNPISLGQNVGGAAITPDGRRLVLTFGQSNLKVINAADNTELQFPFIDVGIGPTDVVVSQDSRRAFVLSVAAQRVTAVDLDNLRSIGSVPLAGLLPNSPAFLSVGPNGMIYASAETRVLEIDPRGSEISAVNVRRQFNLPVGSRAGRLVFTPDGTRAIAVNFAGGSTGDLVFFFHLDLTNGNNATAALRSTDLSGVFFDKMFVVSNTRAYGVASTQSTKPRALYEFTLPPVGSTAPFEAPTLREAFLGSLGNVAATDTIATSNEYPAAVRMYISAPLNLIQPLAQNTVYAVDMSGANPNVVGTLPFAFLPGAIGWGTAASTLERGDRVGGFVPTNVRQPNPGAGGTTLPFGVRVLNALGRPMYNVPVIFTPITPGASVEGAATVTTNADGIALASAKAPAAPGEFTIQVSIGGSNFAQAFIFQAGPPSGGGSGGGTGTASGIIILEGDGQVVSEGNFSLRPVRIRVTDTAGKAIVGASVSWAINQGGGRWRDGTIDPAAAEKLITVTDDKGESQNSFVGIQSVGFGNSFVQTVATVTSGTSTAELNMTTVRAFTDTGSPAPLPSVLILAPTNEPPSIRGKAGETLVGAIRMAIQNSSQPQFGAVLQKVGIQLSTFNATNDAPEVQCVPRAIPLSNEQGIVTCDLKLAGKAGAGTIKVLVGGFSERNINLTVDPGDPAELRITNGNQQSGEANQNLPAILQVRVVDGGGNPLAGVTVRWEVIQGQATVANSTTISDLNGLASNNLRLGANPGSILIRATALSGSLPSATFEASVAIRLQGVNKLSGDNQNTFTNTAYPLPLVVQVLDTRNQAVANQTVEWAVLEGGGTLSAASSTTNSNGQASINVRAGATAGTIRVRATVPGLTGAQQIFTLTVQLPGPLINALDFFNAASGERGAIVPGGIYTFTGTGLAPDLRGCSTASPFLGQLPTRVAGVEVQFGTVLAPIFSVCNLGGREQVTIQVPFELAAGGAVAITVRVGAGNSVVNGVQVVDLQPGIFETTDAGGRRFAVALRPNGSFVTPDNPARYGEIIRVYITGAGPVTPGAATGSSGVPTQNINAAVVVGLNDQGARLVSATYAVGMVGVYEIAFEVTNGTATGLARPLGVIMTRANGQTVFPGNSPTIAIAP